MIKLTNREMQKRFVVLDPGATDDHGDAVRKAACKAYVTGCEDSTDFSGKLIGRDGKTLVDRTDGTTPFSSFENRTIAGFTEYKWYLQEFEKLGSVKIVTESVGPDGGGTFAEQYGASLPFLNINGAGNKGQEKGDTFLPTQDRHWKFYNHDEITGEPILVGEQVDTETPLVVLEAIAADKVIYVAGHMIDANGNYVRDPSSSGCKGRGGDYGCIWAPIAIKGVGWGTSFSSPIFGAALASVLAVFPDTHHTELARFGKACALKKGNGIEALLQKSGGVGVADFHCMGGVVDSLAKLPSGGTATITINGQAVNVGGRSVSLAPQASVASYVMRQASIQTTGRAIPASVAYAPEKDGFSFEAVQTEAGSMSVAGVQKVGSFFALAAIGERKDFFGFSNGHGNIINTEISAGHQNAFLRFEKQFSRGGVSIRDAEGESLGFTIQKGVDLTDGVFLSASVRGDRFLGGEASIPYGRVNLDKGKWEHRVSLATDIAVAENATLNISGGARFPASGESESNIFAGYSLRY